MFRTLRLAVIALGLGATVAAANPIGYVSGLASIYTVDLANGSVLDTQSMARTALALALDANGTLWGAFFITGSTYQMGTIDPTTGVITYSPDTFTGVLNNVYGLAFDDLNNLFLLDGQAIYSMNQATGAISGTYSNCDISGTTGLGFGRDGNAWTTAATQIQEVPQSGCGTFGGSVPGGSGVSTFIEMANSGATFYAIEAIGSFTGDEELVSFDGTTFSSTPSLTALGSLPSNLEGIAAPHIASIPEPSAFWLLGGGTGLLVLWGRRPRLPIGAKRRDTSGAKRRR